MMMIMMTVDLYATPNICGKAMLMLQTRAVSLPSDKQRHTRSKNTERERDRERQRQRQRERQIRE